MNNNLRVVIDSGHGGTDSGAVGNGIKEKDYTLLISNYMKKRFDELGIPSTLTRNSDETISPSERVNRILNSYGNNSDVIVISNHINSGGGEGAEVIYALRNKDTLANLILNNLGAEGLQMRKVYQRRLPNDTSKDYYFIHRETGITEPLIVEYGFIDNINDVNKLMNNYERYAEGVVKAIANYKGINYTNPTTKNEYIVQKGDSLWNISKKFGISVDEIKRLNNLNSNLIYVGQVLKLPGYETTTDSNITYIVKKGDTLYSIASKNNVTVDELMKLNNLSNTNLSIGQQLKIKETESIITPSENEVINENSIYTVKKGDTLYSIAKKNNTTVDKLKEINNIVNDILTIGASLFIPNSNLEDIIIHKVVSGDSLWGLANKYKTTIEDIKQLNNLVSDLLVIGTDLQIKRNTI